MSYNSTMNACCARNRINQVPKKMQLYYLNIPDDIILKLLPEIWTIILKDYLIFDYTDKKTFHYIGEKLEKIYRTIEYNEYYIYTNYIQKCRRSIKLNELRIQLRHIITCIRQHCDIVKEYNLTTFFENKTYRDTPLLFLNIDYETIHRQIDCDCKLEKKKRKHQHLCKCIKNNLIDIWTQFRDILYFFNNAVNMPHNGLFLNHYHYNLIASRVYKLKKVIKTIN